MSSYEAPPELEELHLLGKLVPSPLIITHSATLAIAERLRVSGDGMLIFSLGLGANWLEITAQGLRRLVEQGPKPRPCPFCGCNLVVTAFRAGWGHPHRSQCILADYATSKIDEWNIRYG
jgi:hypothetical protein